MTSHICKLELGGIAAALDHGGSDVGSAQPVGDPSILAFQEARQIIRQVEYYLDKKNLVADHYLQKQLIQHSGWIPISELASFTRLSSWANDHAKITHSLRTGSRLVEVDSEGKRVRPRKKPLEVGSLGPGPVVPAEVKQALQRGKELYNQKRFAEARNAFSISLQAQPSAAAYSNRALALLKLKEYKAVDADVKALVMLLLKQQPTEENRHKRAVAYFLRGTARTHLARLHKEDISLQKKYWEDARADFCRCSSLDPSYPNIKSKIAMTGKECSRLREYEAHRERSELELKVKLLHEVIETLCPTTHHTASAISLPVPADSSSPMADAEASSIIDSSRLGMSKPHSTVCAAMQIVTELEEKYKTKKQQKALVEELSKPNETALPLLQLAIINQHRQALRILVEVGMDVNQRSKVGDTALMWSCLHGCLQDVQFLLEANADVSIRNEYGQSCLSFAVQENHPQVVECLLAVPAVMQLLHQREMNGRTPFLLAVERSNLKLAKRLHKAGAELNVEDMSLFNALDIALHSTEANREEIVEWLRGLGLSPLKRPTADDLDEENMSFLDDLTIEPF
eukprot:gb/GEZN01005264.1/.p1 GENE.gb/GEZN01005264.1/~~gb/GEZN01005264.1/.p1  ORF type:complete len:572 (-),score=83.00 gb/GEZN01005264.1/:46-1761(-)